MNKTKRVNATMQVVNSIKESLQTGELKVGDRLPNEADMANEIGVGRSSLREGIKILAAYGVVEPRQGEGTFIVDNRATNFFEFMGFFPSRENMQYFMELRRVLETGNIVAIYDKLTQEDFDRLEDSVQQFSEELSVEEYVRVDKEFHTILLSHTQNPMLIQVNNMVEAMRGDLLYKLFLNKDIVDVARNGHRKIVDALKARDLAECIKAVTNHIEVTKDHVDIIY